MCIELSFQRLSIEKWRDFVSLFGESGACGGCWCMLWRLSRKEFERQKGDTYKLAMKTIVAAGEVPGILVFHNSEAIGWCALAPRSRYPALLRSRILQPVDEKQCWSIAGLLIKSHLEKKEYQQILLLAAAVYAKSQGAGLWILLYQTLTLFETVFISTMLKVGNL